MTQQRGPKIALVAVPLMQRSGVYRSAHDLVGAARAMGLEWTAILGVRPDAAGDAIDAPHIREFTFSDHGLKGISSIQKILDESPEVAEADVVITLISQSDMAARTSSMVRSKKWVAWVRGAPWPERGEQSFLRRTILKALETRALKQADQVWATTPILASGFNAACQADIVPAGVAVLPRQHDGTEASAPLVWAGRVDQDKRPELFREIIRESGRSGIIFGEGPLMEELTRTSPPTLHVAGWSDASTLWSNASLFVGTAYREAFGRSAVEAALSGLPVVLGDHYGAAPLLITDPELQDICIIGSDRVQDWNDAIERILGDSVLRRRISDHVYTNASSLTIEESVLAVKQKAQGLLES